MIYNKNTVTYNKKYMLSLCLDTRHKTPNPWNFLDENNPGVFCYVNEVGLLQHQKMRAVCQEKQPFSPTSLISQEERGTRGNYQWPTT